MLELENKEFNKCNNDTHSLSENEDPLEICVEKPSFKKRKINKKKHIYTCMYDDCNKTYSRSSHLRRHEETHENSCHPCTEKGCARIFKTKFTLKKHVDNFHLKKNPKKYKCPDCDQEFNKHSWLARHQYRHTGITPFVCSVEGCGKRFLYPSKLKRHLKVHEGYTCSKENCDQKFPTWTLYVKHVKTAHPIIHRCQFCEKIFTTSSNLKNHLEVHKLDREVYLCPKTNCSRFYFTNRNLKYHLKSYHEKRPFECTLENCYKAFKSQEDLDAHTNHHDSKKKPRKKKKGKARPSFAQRLAGLVPKKIPSSGNTVEQKAEDKLSEDESQNTFSLGISISKQQNEADRNSEFSNPVESNRKNEDGPCFINPDRTDLGLRVESNLYIEETMLNNKLISPHNSMKCISA